MNDSEEKPLTLSELRALAENRTGGMGWLPRQKAEEPNQEGSVSEEIAVAWRKEGRRTDCVWP